jgi:alpha-ketoglutarate-dependent taurine dioxygenase
MFRAQKNLGHDGHKELINRMGKLSGRPKESTLMQAALWPVYKDDPEVASLVPERLAARYGFSDSSSKRQDHAQEWHSDMAFESNPPDFSSLRLGIAAETGGDTMWASGYELYDKLSEPFQHFLETLTATYSQPDYTKACDVPGAYRGPRGHPDNIGFEYIKSHPVVRTNPVTGWKSLFGAGHQVHAGWIDNVTETESEVIKAYCKSLHDYLSLLSSSTFTSTSILT